MNAFQEVPASKSSIARRKLVHGVGVNDTNYKPHQSVNGKVLYCPYFAKWRAMIHRCYSGHCVAYAGCSVDDKWLLLSVFKFWMKSQDWNGMQLDKDLKIKGNKVYSENACLFIPHKLNTILNGRKAARGLYPQGVSLATRNRGFISRINKSGSLKHLGYFNTPKEASKAYQQARTDKIQVLIDNNTYPMATQYLSQHINQGSN